MKKFIIETFEEKVNNTYENIVCNITSYITNDGTKYNDINLEIDDFVKFVYDYDDEIMQNLIINAVEKKIKDDELKELEDIRTELKEKLLNKEFTLLELDNLIDGIVYTKSAFEFDIEELLENKGVSYYYNNNHNIDIEFEVTEKDEENPEYATLKVTNICVN